MNDSPCANKPVVFSTCLGASELSPFHQCYANEHTVLRLAVGRYYVQYDGNDPKTAYWAFRRNAALIDTPERPVEISGPDAVRFLERLFTRRVADMKPGQGRYVLACTHEGGLFTDGIVFRLDDNCFWFVQPDCELDAWFLAHRQGFEVSVSDPQSRVLQIQGPKSLQVMRAATGGVLDEAFKYFRIGLFSIGGEDVYVSRTGWTGELGYEVYTRQGDFIFCVNFIKNKKIPPKAGQFVLNLILYSHVRECQDIQMLSFSVESSIGQC